MKSCKIARLQPQVVGGRGLQDSHGIQILEPRSRLQQASSHEGLAVHHHLPRRPCQQAKAWEFNPELPAAAPAQHLERHRHAAPASSAVSSAPLLSTQRPFCAGMQSAQEAIADQEVGAGDLPDDVDPSELMRLGRLPLTTPEQRSRQKLSHDTLYRIPQRLRRALKEGWINPNLPPPTGLEWRPIPGGWLLHPRGG